MKALDQCPRLRVGLRREFFSSNRGSTKPAKELSAFRGMAKWPRSVPNSNASADDDPSFVAVRAWPHAATLAGRRQQMIRGGKHGQDLGSDASHKCNYV